VNPVGQPKLGDSVNAYLPMENQSSPFGNAAFNISAGQINFIDCQKAGVVPGFLIIIVIPLIKINFLKAYQILASVSIFVMVSCNKSETAPHVSSPGTNVTRKVRFELFTRENFAGNKENIQFTIHMGRAPGPLFDSTLATMKIEDIPDSMHRIIIEKTVPGKDTATIEVGFLYAIENVGNSWYLEPLYGTESFKVVKYAFR
jgi:hypothetical protein